MDNERLRCRGLRMPVDSWAWLDREAELIGSTASQLVREAVLRLKRERESWREREMVAPGEEASR